MSFNSIVMTYKENCKVEGEIMTKFKIARMYFAGGKTQLAISKHIRCHKNTVFGIIAACNGPNRSLEIWDYLRGNGVHIEAKKMIELFSFFGHESRCPHGHKLAIQANSAAEKVIVERYTEKHYGVRRLFKHLDRQGHDVTVFTIGKIKGVYKRNGFKGRKIRTANGERRSLYNYDEIEAFQWLQYDTKQVLDKHAIPADIYEKFKNNTELPIYQWTIIDAKTKTRFLAWSRYRTSTFGFRFLEFTINWLRSHGVAVRINIQMDMGVEFYSGSKAKQEVWNSDLMKYNAYAYDTEGVKWKQNIVERSHKTDDEEFYCPRGGKINSKADFIVEGQFWIMYYNHRSSDGIGMNGLSPKEKLEQLGFQNAEQICNFPCLILDDFFQPFLLFFNPEFNELQMTRVDISKPLVKSQNVLTYYLLREIFFKTQPKPKNNPKYNITDSQAGINLKNRS